MKRQKMVSGESKATTFHCTLPNVRTNEMCSVSSKVIFEAHQGHAKNAE